ncbi:MAG: pyrimidine 5'-nucleotidase [Alphaproteobacteria bacterium]
MQPPAAGDLARVRDWVFDLDNTLYPRASRLFDQVDVRMGTFLAEQFSLDRVKAREMQKRYFHQYGTTLRGLLLHHPEVDPHRYLEYVHDLDLTVIPPAPDLDAALAALPGRKLVFTNGSLRHAEGVLARLGIAHHFADIFDVAAAEFVCKPDPDCYQRMMRAHGVTPTQAALFEDTLVNLPPAAELGMTTVLVTPLENAEAAVPTPSPAGPVHYVTDDLAGWLKQAAESLKTA